MICSTLAPAAVERFARRRLEGDDFAPLDHH
jgi:hypothetical protein